MVLLTMSAQAGVIVDNFSNTPGQVTTNDTIPFSNSPTNPTYLTDTYAGLNGIVLANGATTGVRTVNLSRLDYFDTSLGQAVVSQGSVTTNVNPNLQIASFSSDDNTIGTGAFVYDNGAGTTVSGNYNLNAIGLRNGTGTGISLTGGAANFNAFQGSIKADLNGSLMVFIYTDAGDYSTYRYDFSGGPSYQTFSLPFAGFVNQAGTGANFNNIGAIKVLVNSQGALGTPSLDASFRFLQSGYDVPETSSVVMVVGGMALLGLMRFRRTAVPVKIG